MPNDPAVTEPDQVTALAGEEIAEGARAGQPLGAVLASAVLARHLASSDAAQRAWYFWLCGAARLGAAQSGEQVAGERGRLVADFRDGRGLVPASAQRRARAKMSLAGAAVDQEP